MNTQNQRICTFSVLIFLVLLFGGLVTAGFMPPMDPKLGADQVKEVIVEHQTRIRIGLLLALLSTCFSAPFVAVISVQLKRIEGPRSPFAYAQLILGLMIPVLLMLPLSWLMTATYRPERPAEDILVLTDQAWMLFVGAFYAVIIQFACVGTAILRDPSATPVFPRWLGYLSFWCAIGSLPAAGLYFVKVGPFAWNNLLSWWLPVIVFGVWLIAMFVMILRAIADEERIYDTKGAEDPDLDLTVTRVLKVLAQRGLAGEAAPQN